MKDDLGQKSGREDDFDRESDMEDDPDQKSAIYPRTEDDLPPADPPPTFTIDGQNIKFLHGDNQYPQYSFSDNIFRGGRGGLVILYTFASSETLGLRRIYEFESTRESNRTMDIEGQAAGEAIFKNVSLYQEHHYSDTLTHISLHKPWKVVEKGQSNPIIEIRLAEGQGLFHSLLHHSEGRRFAWHDSTGKLIAMEHRAVYTRTFENRTVVAQAMEQSRSTYSWAGEIQHMPSLEILVQLDEKMVDFLIAVWVAKIWQESIYLHPTTMGITSSGNWNTY